MKKTRDELEYQIKYIQKSDIPLRFKIISLPMNYQQNHILSQLQRWQIMDSSDTEYHKLNKWLESIQNYHLINLHKLLFIIDHLYKR